MDWTVAKPFPNDIPFLAEMGVEFLGAIDGEARVALTLGTRHMNSWQVGHGGVTMTLLDVVMALAGRSLDPAASGAVTVDMHTSFLQPAGHPGSRIIAIGRASHRATMLVFCEGEVRNGDLLVARAMGTFKFLKQRAAGRKLDHTFKP
jgi:acyl-CoA thioesterase